MPSRPRMIEASRGGVGGDDLLAERGRPPAARASAASVGEIDRAALGMQIEQTLCELADLGDAAGDGDARHRDGRADI